MGGNAMSLLNSRLQTHPYTTNSLIACAMMGVGDQCAQEIERRHAAATAESRNDRRPQLDDGPGPGIHKVSRPEHSHGVEMLRRKGSQAVFTPLQHEQEVDVGNISTSIEGGNASSMHRKGMEDLPGWVRTLSLCSFSTFVFSPFCGWWYGKIAAWQLPPWIANRPFLSVPKGCGTGARERLAKRVLLATNCFRGACGNLGIVVPLQAIFYIQVTTLEHWYMQSQSSGTAAARKRDQSPSLTDKLRVKLVDILPYTCMASSCLWIPVTILNFHFCPPPYRIMVTNGVSFCWNTCLSLIQHNL